MSQTSFKVPVSAIVESRSSGREIVKENVQVFTHDDQDVESPLNREVSWKLEPTPGWVIWVATVLLLISGTYDSIAFKWMNMQYLPPCNDCEPKYFEGPFYQTLVMYIGELLCLAVYWIDYYLVVHKKGKKCGTFDMPTNAASFAKPECPVWWWMVPTALDYTSSSMINYATIFTLASTVQILGSFSVLLTAILALAYLRVALRVHHYCGIAVVTIGIIITAVYSLGLPAEETNYDTDMSYIGIILSLAGYGLSSFQFVFEEKLFRKYYCSPMYGVGCEGVFGTILGIVILIICQFAGWEDVKGCMYQTAHSTNILVADFTSFFSVMVFNGTGLMVTKMGSGLLRAILFSLRSCLVWLVEMFLSWNDFDWLDFGGLLLVAFGVLVYNNVLPYMCCPGFKKVMNKPIEFWCVKAEPEDEGEEILKHEIPSHSSGPYEEDKFRDSAETEAFTPHRDDSSHDV